MNGNMAGVILNLLGTGVIVAVAGLLLWDKIKGFQASIKELYGRTDSHEVRIRVREVLCLERHGADKED